MSAEFMRQPFPRPLLLGAATLLSFVTLSAALSPRADTARTALSAPSESGIALRFTDRADGGIVVHDDVTGQELTTVPPGGGGFVRAALRALSRDRKLAHARPDAPFLLDRDAAGRPLLIDTTNGRIVDLAAFGPTNAGAFAALLERTGAAP